MAAVGLLAAGLVAGNYDGGGFFMARLLQRRRGRGPHVIFADCTHDRGGGDRSWPDVPSYRQGTHT